MCRENRWFVFLLLYFFSLLFLRQTLYYYTNRFHRVFHCRFIKINDCAHKYYCVFALISSRVSRVGPPSVYLKTWAPRNTVRTKYCTLRVRHHLITLHGAVIILRSNHFTTKIEEKKNRHCSEYCLVF